MGDFKTGWSKAPIYNTLTIVVYVTLLEASLLDLYRQLSVHNVTNILLVLIVIWGWFEMLTKDGQIDYYKSSYFSLKESLSAHPDEKGDES